MILRRLTKHVKEHNWFAVGLDFLIVVAGILIAFQITSWNEGRQDRRDEQRYLAELSRDMSVNMARAQEHQLSTLQRLAFAEKILVEIDPEYDRPQFWPEISEEASPDPEFIDYPYAALTTSVYLVAADSTFEELIQTGRIGVISNRELVSDLTEFYNEIEQYSNADDIVFAQVQPMLGRAIEYATIHCHLGRAEKPRIRQDQPVHRAVVADRIHQNIARIRRQTRVLRVVQYIAHQTAIALRIGNVGSMARQHLAIAGQAVDQPVLVGVMGACVNDNLHPFSGLLDHCPSLYGLCA